MKEKQQFKRIRNLFSNDEQKALESVMTKSGQRRKNLRACHTETMFVWEVKR